MLTGIRFVAFWAVTTMPGTSDVCTVPPGMALAKVMLVTSGELPVTVPVARKARTGR